MSQWAHFSLVLSAPSRVDLSWPQIPSSCALQEPCPASKLSSWRQWAGAVQRSIMTFQSQQTTAVDFPTVCKALRGQMLDFYFSLRHFQCNFHWHQITEILAVKSLLKLNKITKKKKHILFFTKKKKRLLKIKEKCFSCCTVSQSTLLHTGWEVLSLCTRWAPDIWGDWVHLSQNLIIISLPAWAAALQRKLEILGLGERPQRSGFPV